MIDLYKVNILNAFLTEEITADQLRKGDIYKASKNNWEVVFDIKIEDWNRNNATKRINVSSTPFSLHSFYNFNNVFETVSIIKRDTYNLDIVIAAIDAEKERHRIRQEECDAEEAMLEEED